MQYRQANIEDISALKSLVLKSWRQYEKLLFPGDWETLSTSLINDELYARLIKTAFSQLCQNEKSEIIGMAFLVQSGNPTDIFDATWSYIRLLTIDPNYAGKGIGKTLTQYIISYAIKNGEQIIALHTSEMMHAARHLYEKFGFKIIREIPPRFRKRYWLYIKELDKL